MCDQAAGIHVMSKTVLSIEDDDAVEMLLQVAFRETARDFRLIRVPNGEEGLAFLRRTGRYANAQRPDLVLLNVNMPGISGPEVLQQMKNDESLRDIPAVVFTSSHMDQDRAKCLALGARDFILKPSSFEGVLEAVRTACAHAA
jgi:CheY-like chemotaxis protein